jgi:hypothetical protein
VVNEDRIMKKSTLSLIAVALSGSALLPLAGAALAGKAAPVSASVPGEKLDSGLGDLPRYSEWKDKTGKDPMGRSMQYAQKQ